MFPLLLFIFGLLSALGALIGELFVTSFLVDPSIVTQITFIPNPLSLLIFAFIEEGSKLLFLFQAKRRFHTLSTPILTGLMFGLGFSSLEFFALQFLSQLPSGPWYGIILLHIITSFLATLTITKTHTKKAILATLLALTLIHFSYNILL